MIAPSVLSADFSRLGEEVRDVTEGGADLLHLDIMDGHFVPNLTFGPPVIAPLRKWSTLPMEAHLMVSNPSSLVEPMARAGVNRLIVHAETDPHLNRLIESIRIAGMSAGVAINPSTPLTVLEEILPLVDLILIMTVNPGFGGQSFIEGALSKIRRLMSMKDLLACHNVRIEVDGGISVRNIAQVVSAGADTIVAGTAIFSGPSRKDAIFALREAAGSLLV
jgi:ribulose-phosphate 3-epimerase